MSVLQKALSYRLSRLARVTTRGVNLLSSSTFPRIAQIQIRRPITSSTYDSAQDLLWSRCSSVEEEEIVRYQEANSTGPNAAPFSLSPSFVNTYQHRTPPFGFNGLGEFVYQTRYARLLPSGERKERWHETVERVVNGVYNMQRRWIVQNHLGWDARKAHASAREMYDRIWSMKFLPPGRGLWAMGTPITEERFLYAALNNCAFVSTGKIGEGPSTSSISLSKGESEATRPFTFLMDAAMLGVGVGFDTDGAGKLRVLGPSLPSLSNPSLPIKVEDSREGWVGSLRVLLESHFFAKPKPVFDYSKIRPRGAPIRGFGGTASGFEMLKRLHDDVDKTLSPLAGLPITLTAIVDIMNLIGRCVVSGDVRQTAEIAFGRADSEEYIDLKNYTKNPRRAEFGWTSNNSVYAELGMDYGETALRVRDNGEPGYAWLDNMRAFGRMSDPPNFKDSRAKGGNPCLEQTLESFELCCLVETFPNNHNQYYEFARTLRFAFLYAKTVTLGQTHWPESNRVMQRNRRIGTSISGVAQFIASRGTGKLKEWCDRGYDEVARVDARLSEWLAIPRSVKTTCVKPSGTVSLLAGATPGMHFPESRFYLRRVRLGKDHELVQPLQDAGYAVEPAAEDPSRKLVVTFPVDAAASTESTTSVSVSNDGSERLVDCSSSSSSSLLTLDDVTMWEQLSLAALLQRYWADNQVSCTVTFDPEREGKQIARALDFFQYQLKGVSLLPRAPILQYKQLPYEACTEAQYKEAVSKIRPGYISEVISGIRPSSSLKQSKATDNNKAPDNFCDTESCDKS